jgi:hypothetical protein
MQQNNEDASVLVNLALLLQHRSHDLQGAEDCFERSLPPPSS